MNGLDPYAWLKDTLEKLPTWPNSRLDELLPLANPVTIDNPPPYQCFPNPIGVTGLVAYRTLTFQPSIGNNLFVST